MYPRGHKRQVLLFLITVIVPCLVLVVLGLRIIGQERELAGKRAAEERRRLANAVRQELLTVLERIRLREVSALVGQSGAAVSAASADPAVALVGWVQGDRLMLPWETLRAAAEFRQLLSEAPFAQKIQQGEREEFTGNQCGKAAASYSAAMALARHPAQGGYARLLLARALTKCGRRDEARAHDLKLLTLPSQLTDEQGVPLALYAAKRLLDAGVEHAAVAARIQEEAETKGWLPPAEAHMLSGLAGRIAPQTSEGALREAAEATQRKIAERIRFLEQALALQNDFPSLKLVRAGGQAGEAQPLWAPYGKETWLVSVAPAPAGRSLILVAVRADDVFHSLDSTARSSAVLPAGMRFLTTTEAQGESLGENFPGLRVVLAVREESALVRQSKLQRAFYSAALLLVLSVTLFGAYFLWRDVRRELRLAELRSQFVSSVTHELKTPLTAIRMFAETLQMGRTVDQRLQAEYLQTIVNESERLTRLLNNVLDFAKIEQGKKAYRLEPASLADVVRAAARAMNYPLAQQGFALRVQVDDGLPPVRADADALQQAILNLLTNAMKYSGQSREIDLRLRRENGYAVIEVTDRGVGIAPEEQERIFEKFYRAPTPENGLIPGAGLGLALAEHIAAAHGGRVAVRSAPGQGSTFTIRLPLERQS
jgi:signal transduction histidine kinase